ncbi:MAG TPA: hypothetical protein VJ873_09240, partial [bacterium]|nr:hypothetical protein [bacterium]
MNTFVTPSLAVNTMLPRKRILYVEDNPGDARLFQEVLERYGAGEFHIEHETSLAGGLQKLSEDR